MVKKGEEAGDDKGDEEIMGAGGADDGNEVEVKGSAQEIEMKKEDGSGEKKVKVKKSTSRSTIKDLLEPPHQTLKRPRLDSASSFKSESIRTRSGVVAIEQSGVSSGSKNEEHLDEK